LAPLHRQIHAENSIFISISPSILKFVSCPEPDKTGFIFQHLTFQIMRGYHHCVWSCFCADTYSCLGSFHFEQLAYFRITRLGLTDPRTGKKALFTGKAAVLFRFLKKLRLNLKVIFSEFLSFLFNLSGKFQTAWKSE